MCYIKLLKKVSSKILGKNRKSNIKLLYLLFKVIKNY